MEKFLIHGGKKISGEIDVKPAKNAILPQLAATILTDEKVLFENSADLVDIETMLQLLENLGAEITGVVGGRIEVCCKNLKPLPAPYEIVKKMRAGILVLGPLLARFKKAKVSFPGGCAIGTRPVDQHLKGLKAMGAKIEIEEGYIVAETEGLRGCEIFFDKVTVGGTENILMAAVLAKGNTLISNAAREPEIVDLGNMLIKMGAKIEGLGTDTIKVYGVEKLKGTTHNPIPDRVECGTLLAAAAITKGKLKVKNCIPAHLESFLLKLEEMGFILERGDDYIHIDGEREVYSVDVTTAPYPGFPTDLQAQFVALLTQANGIGAVREEIFESRFLHIPELQRLGANIKLEGNVAIVKGVTKLKGAEVMASDLRASASLVLAGLVAEGKTVVDRIYHLDRGYESFEKRLNSIGAEIERIKA